MRKCHNIEHVVSNSRRDPFSSTAYVSHLARATHKRLIPPCRRWCPNVAVLHGLPNLTSRAASKTHQDCGLIGDRTKMPVSLPLGSTPVAAGTQLSRPREAQARAAKPEPKLVACPRKTKSRSYHTNTNTPRIHDPQKRQEGHPRSSAFGPHYSSGTSRFTHVSHLSNQKSEHLPLRSQSPNLVGSPSIPPLVGPPHSFPAGPSCSISSISSSSSSAAARRERRRRTHEEICDFD